MTVELPENASWRAAPLARISRAALDANLTALGFGASAQSTDLSEALRADAWGHGAAFVEEALAGLTSGATDASAAGAPSTPVDPERLFGLVPGYMPVMSLVGRVLSVKRLRAGEGVSYGYTHRATRDTTIALVTGGYAQGIVRALGNRANVLVGGESRPVIGRVAMDACVIDLGEVPASRGDEVEFFGRDRPIGEWAAVTGMRAGELVAAVGLRVEREYGS